MTEVQLACLATRNMCIKECTQDNVGSMRVQFYLDSTVTALRHSAFMLHGPCSNMQTLMLHGYDSIPDHGMRMKRGP